MRTSRRLLAAAAILLLVGGLLKVVAAIGFGIEGDGWRSVSEGSAGLVSLVGSGFAWWARRWL